MNMKLFWALVIGGCLFPPLWIVAIFMLVIEQLGEKKPKEETPK